MVTQAGGSRDRLSRRPLAADGDDTPAPGAGSPGARAWLLFLGGGALLALLYVAMPYGRPAGALYIGASLGSALIVAFAVRRRRLFCPAAWVLLACALALTTVGHSIWYWLDFRGLIPFPSIADVVYLAGYPLFAAALWRLGRGNGGDGGVLIDALVVGVSAAVLGWALLIAPYVNDPTLGMLQLVVSTAYPVADLILLPLVVRLLFQYGLGIRAYHFLLQGMLLYTVVADGAEGRLAHAGMGAE